MIRSKKIIHFSAVLLLLGFTLIQQTLAREVSTLEISVINNFNFGTWAVGTGSLTDSSVHCVASSNYSDSFTEPVPIEVPPAERLPYQYKLIDKAASTGYYLYLGNDTTNTGNATIKVSFSHADIATGSGYELLADDTYDNHSHVGRYRLCKDGDNSELKIDISSIDLEQARAGAYKGYFTAQVQGGSTGTDTAANDFRIDLSIANIVRISGLSDIHIGDYYGGIGNLIKEETFCVYSNNAGAGYSLTIIGANQDATGNFFVTNTGATVSVPYLLQFKADTTAGGGAQVSTTAFTAVGSNSSSVCGGVDNAKLTLTVLDTDMQAVLPDSFTDTLTLLVAPL